jgi:hypothetical protein
MDFPPDGKGIGPFAAETCVGSTTVERTAVAGTKVEADGPHAARSMQVIINTQTVHDNERLTISP